MEGRLLSFKYVHRREPWSRSIGRPPITKEVVSYFGLVLLSYFWLSHSYFCPTWIRLNRGFQQLITRAFPAQKVPGSLKVAPKNPPTGGWTPKIPFLA